MCGICGVAGADPGAPPVDFGCLQLMTEVITHRGPDEDGYYLGPGAALGMRRLSVIDLEASHQPLTNEDGTVVCVFNGEIFNFRALRQRLLAGGHQLRTMGDTETIVHLYEDYSEDFPRQLHGMFAIAVWDTRRRKLLLARDRLGVKPLYYAITSSGICFASEIKALLASDLVSAELDLNALRLLLTFGYAPGEQTIFANVKKLPPASILQVGRRGTEGHRAVLDSRRASAGCTGVVAGRRRAPTRATQACGTSADGQRRSCGGDAQRRARFEPCGSAHGRGITQTDPYVFGRIRGRSRRKRTLVGKAGCREARFGASRATYECH